MVECTVNTLISFNREQSVNLYGKNFKQYSDNFNFKISMESVCGRIEPIEEPLKLILTNCGETYEITNYEIIDGYIFIDDPSNITQLIGRLEFRLMFGNNVSYPTVFYVDGCTLPEDIEGLFPLSIELYGNEIQLDSERTTTVTKAIDNNTSSIEELQTQIDNIETGDVDLTPYRTSVDQDVIDNNLQNQINNINIGKADKTDLDLAKEHINENTQAIINNDTRITNLENQFTLLPDFDQFLTEEEDPIFNAWLATFDMGQFVNREATLLDDFKNLSLDSGYYYTDEDTLNDTSGGNISNAELIVSPTLRTWIGIDKWNGVYIRSYIIETGTWNPWRQLLSTKDIADLEAQVEQNTNDIAELKRYYENKNITVHSVISTPSEIGRISGHVAGKYRLFLHCHAYREDGANTKQTLNLKITNGTTILIDTNFNTFKDFDQPFTLNSGVKYDLTVEDLFIEVSYDGSIPIIIENVEWSIEG